MRVSDLVKDVIFLVGSMECFSQVTNVFFSVNMAMDSLFVLSQTFYFQMTSVSLYSLLMACSVCSCLYATLKRLLFSLSYILH